MLFIVRVNSLFHDFKLIYIEIDLPGATIEISNAMQFDVSIVTGGRCDASHSQG
jgi:hypothetical protein